MPGGLLREPNFRRFWIGETVAQFGQQITQLAVRLTAVILFGASSGKLGLLNAAAFAPYLLFTLPAGKLADVADRRRLMVISNAGRALVFLALPAMSALGVLRLEHLIVLSFVAATMAVVFDVSSQSFVPILVRPDQLVEGNTKLYASVSAAQIGGPGLGGLLIQLIGAPTALLANGIGFMVSVWTLMRVRVRPPEPSTGTAGASGIAAGLRFILRDSRLLRSCVLQGALYNLCWMAMQTVFVVYAADRLGFSAGLIGAVIAAGAAGSLAGSLLAGAVNARLGLGPATVGAVGAQCVGLALIPVVGDASRPLLVGWLALSFLVMGLGTAMTNVNVVSLRQTITPPGLLGRMNAAYRFANWGVLPLGALAGGQLAIAFGDRMALAIIGICGFTSLAALWWSPLRRCRVLTDAAADRHGSAPSRATLVPEALPCDGR